MFLSDFWHGLKSTASKVASGAKSFLVDVVKPVYDTVKSALPEIKRISATLALAAPQLLPVVGAVTAGAELAQGVVDKIETVRGAIG